MDSQRATLIPFYQDQLQDWEEWAVMQSLTILNDRPVLAMIPKRLGGRPPFDPSRFHAVIEFEDHWFQSPQTYSRLLTSPIFWESLAAWEWILICQTDAVLVADPFQVPDFFIAPYTGCPVSKRDIATGEHLGWMRHQNGGLSIRNVAQSLNVVDPVTKAQFGRLRFELFWEQMGLTGKQFRSPAYRFAHMANWWLRSGRHLRQPMSVEQLQSREIIAEDCYFTNLAEAVAPSFKPSPVEVAMKFGVQNGLDGSAPQSGAGQACGFHTESNLKGLRVIQSS